MENQEMNLTVQNDEQKGFIADLTAPRKTMFSSLQPKSETEKKILFKASNNPEKRVGDCINMEINVKDIFAEVVTCVNRETGEASEAPRIVLIDDKGVGYQAVSLGVFSAVKKLIGVYGVPTWKNPIKVKVVQITKGDRKILTLDVA